MQMNEAVFTARLLKLIQARDPELGAVLAQAEGSAWPLHSHTGGSGA